MPSIVDDEATRDAETGQTLAGRSVRTPITVAPHDKNRDVDSCRARSQIELRTKPGNSEVECASPMLGTLILLAARVSSHSGDRCRVRHQRWERARPQVQAAV